MPCLSGKGHPIPGNVACPWCHPQQLLSRMSLCPHDGSLDVALLIPEELPALGTWGRTCPSCHQTPLRVRGLALPSSSWKATYPKIPRGQAPGLHVLAGAGMRGQGINTRVTLLVAGGQLPPPQGQACWSCRPPFPPFLHPPSPPHGVPGTPGTWNWGLSDGTAEGSSFPGHP